MATVRAWTALFKGYFTTTVQPMIIDQFGQVPDASLWPLTRVREKFTELFEGQYGDMANHPEAVEALNTYRPTWEAEGPMGTTVIWSWGQHTDVLLSRILAPE